MSFYGNPIISDFRHLKENQKKFDEAGMQTKLLPASYFITIPTVAVLQVSK
ncbi:MAG: hypothetical protein KG003_15435 [Bacteroidetes bacterium]|nr:hypothetical protein [Bacteroidota bacterium]